MMRNIEAYRRCCLLGNNIAKLGLGWVATDGIGTAEPADVGVGIDAALRVVIPAFWCSPR